jgi:SPP1 family predicted phage head-tail adaptor
MNPGDLKHRGTFRSLKRDVDGNPLVDAAGQPTGEREDFATVWCAIEPLSSRWREYFAAAQVNSEVTIRIRTRYLDGVDPSMLFVSGAHIFEILSIIHPELAKRELHLMCKERQ